MAQELLVQNRYKLLNPESWLKNEDEPWADYTQRINAQSDIYKQHWRVYGWPFLIRYGSDDHRVLWQKEIKPDKLINEVKSPIGTKYQCPLCQPYDNWNGYGKEHFERRYLCKIIDPLFGDIYRNDAQMRAYWIECVTNGFYAKCVCLGRR